MINKLFEELEKLPEVEAIALGGSRASENYDEKSDYDVYLYVKSMIKEETRRKILEKYCSYMEIGNHYWESEDNCILNNGIDIDILYRNIDSFGDDVSSVVEKCEPHNGYTTCMWHNLLTCKIIYDRDGRLQKLKERFSIPYPTLLQKNIIERNVNLLYRALPAYRDQILKASSRDDRVSIVHRTAAFFESYFDVIFALNKLTHPGEKRLVKLALKKCSILPNNFQKNIDKLLNDMLVSSNSLKDDLDTIISELKIVLKENGFKE